VDTSPPPVELTRPSEGAVLKGPDVRVEGETEPWSRVRVFLGEELVGEGLAGPEGRFELVARGLKPGRHSLKVEALDRAGNLSSRKVGIVVDTTPPSLDISSPKVGQVIPERFLYVRGFTEPGAEVSVKVQGVEVGRAVAGDRGEFKVGPITFETEGAVKVSVTVRDKAGWTRTIERLVSLDFTPPPIEVKFPPPGRPFESAKGELVVLTEPGAKVSLKAEGRVVAEATADEKGLAFLSGFLLLPGSNKFTLEAVDKAGHIRQREVMLVYDRTREQLRRLGYPEEVVELVEGGAKPQLKPEFK